ncbi:OmpA family protein [Hydrogenophaga sp. T2]|uniref:OmpA family protein n=1 Tax=Hydrogenophaga sp. T2 TaxID=3132823 RepID=UPI003CF3083C
MSTTGVSRDNSDRSYKLFGGHQFNRNLALEGGYFNLGETDFSANTAPAGTLAGHGRDMDTATISVVFPFGRYAPMRAAAAAPAAPMPLVVAQAPAPAPAPAPVLAPPEPAPTPPPAPQRTRFAAETLFGFGAAALRPEGKTALDDFGRELKGTAYESVRVIGHTDRMGSNDHNQALSSRRAERVKSYLVDGLGLDPARVGARGMGERQPVTASGACPDALARAQRIACLQPDRRVEVDVTGTR